MDETKTNKPNIINLKKNYFQIPALKTKIERHYTNIWGKCVKSLYVFT